MSQQQWWETVGQWEQFQADENREQSVRGERLAQLSSVHFNQKETEMGFKVHEMKSGKFLTKEEVGTGMLVTIKSVERANVAKEGADPEFKFVMHFDELDKPLVLNQINIQVIQMACGGSEDTDDWTGHKIVLFNDPNVAFAGKVTGGIRARAPRQQVKQAIAESKAILKKTATPIEELEDDVPF